MKKNKFIKYKDIKIKIIFQLFEMYYYVIFKFKKRTNNIKASKTSDINNILVIRRDMIWDFIISLPSLVRIKIAFPKAKIHIIWTKWIKSIFNIIKEDFFEKIYLIDPNFWLPKFIRSKTQYLQKNNWDSDDLNQIFKLKDEIDLWIDLRWDLFSLKLLNDLNARKIISYNIWGWSFYIDEKVPFDKDLNEKNHDICLMDYIIDNYSSIKATDIKTDLACIIKDWVIKRLDSGLKYICIQPGWWRWTFRRWPEEKYAELIKVIIWWRSELIIKLLCADSFEELLCKRILNKISNAEKVIIAKSEGWESTIDIINSSVLFIGHDTSTAHLCDMLDHKWIILFWPWDRKLFAPNNKNIKILYHEFDCQPCEQRNCKFPDNSCMNHVSVDEIIGSISTLIGT
ncbi:MAG: hypothetical protein ACD_3C00083G0008 [uncultured bacterium (gcode 4)]|uniref:Uncharacterized protein n=1 Tax=uncultured bacterium (gcode 4) TaxID=1234023 RepID=K2GDE9_9BACT|nr:MAG: hypothetical protein ACD_3C00083G0008 [uncultured bacterium (gcode 4)]